MSSWHQRFLLPEGEGPVPGTLVELKGEEARHMTRVRRLGRGARVLLIDGSGGEYEAGVEKAGHNQALLRVFSKRELKDDRLPVTLMAPVIRRERIDWMIQKVTEMGVRRVIPVVSARCRSGAPGPGKVTRWRAISRQALKQCRGAFAPEILPPSSLEDAVQALAGDSLRLLASEDERGLSVLRAMDQWRPGRDIVLLVGPEGGLVPTETEKASQAGFLPVTLGRRILRSETAALFALAVVSAAMT